jgi:hypothetical protein
MKNILMFMLALLTFSSCKKDLEDVNPKASVVSQNSGPGAPSPLINLYYYVDAVNGNDNNTGASPTTAFKTLTKLNQAYYLTNTAPLGYDLNLRVFLFSNQTHVGHIKVTSSSVKYLGISGYQPTGTVTDRATIDSSVDEGLVVTDNSNLTISDLNITGHGQEYNGVEITSDAKAVDNVSIKNVTVVGFKEVGITLIAKTSQILSNVVIDNAVVHDCDHIGIYSFVYDYPQNRLSNVTIKNSKTYNIKGDGRTSDWSGSGIVLSGVKTALIDNCEAYNVGANNKSNRGGSYGIWAYTADGVVIQNSKSHDNHAGLGQDGGGFDLDGGVINSKIINCQSYANEGPGYGLFEYGTPMGNHDNEISFCSSVDDGQVNAQGAVYFYGSSYNISIHDCAFTNPYKGIKIPNGSYSNIVFSNCTFNIASGVISDPLPAGVSII